MNTKINFKDWLNEKKNSPIVDDVIDHQDLVLFIENTKALVFPGYVEYVKSLDYYLDSKVSVIHDILYRLLIAVNKIEKITIDYDKIINEFFSAIPEIDRIINTDIVALYDGDPAAKSKSEIILCYPGLQAIFAYRIAHVLYAIGVPILPRALSEYAHSLTGIDIHPGATIDEYFFIDHGTGIVIGETCVIGKHVKIYQGVTLGALSLSAGQGLRNVKRHPTIKDNVTIYSGASIFGGETIIGSNTTIGSSVFITSSVEENMIVTLEGQNKKRK